MVLLPYLLPQNAEVQVYPTPPNADPIAQVVPNLLSEGVINVMNFGVDNEKAQWDLDC